MARIRTVKPGFFRHEGLQELEKSHQGLRPMLVFAGLFTQSDREGRFEWKPKQIKLDILPFVDFEIEETLTLLAEHGFINRYEVGRKSYGLIPTFKEHQCPNVREPASRIPAPCQNSTSTIPECREREREVEVERELEGKGNSAPPDTEQNKAFDERDYRNLCKARTELLRTEKSEMGSRYVHEWVQGMSDEDINKYAAQQAGITPWRLTELLARIEPKLEITL